MTRPQPAAAPLAPAAEPSPPLPPPPPAAAPTTTSVTPTSHSSLARQLPTSGRSGQTIPRRQAPQIQPEPTRFTSFADTLEPEQDADDEEEVDDTLESRMEAADSGEDGEAASDAEMESSDAEAEAGDADAESDEEDESEPPAIEE